MSEVSTRIWLDESLWNAIRERALAQGTTVRELLPDVIGQALAGVRPRAEKPAAVAAPVSAAAVVPPSESGPPLAVLADVYQCAVCGMEVKLGGLSQHLGKHRREQEAPIAERSE